MFENFLRCHCGKVMVVKEQKILSLEGAKGWQEESEGLQKCPRCHSEIDKFVHRLLKNKDVEIIGIPFVGQGAIKDADGDLYMGEYKNGEKHGIGINISENGFIIAGEWVKGELQGKGMLIWEDGTVFFGDFSGSIVEGAGLIKYSNGEVFLGNWVENQRNGKGVLYGPDGKVINGSYYINGMKIDGIDEDSSEEE